MKGGLRIFGAAGESEAVKFLRKKGYKIRETNWRCSAGEIDVVAEEGGAVVIVEVKSRRSVSAGDPLEAVDARKQAKLLRLAEAYAVEKKIMDRNLRIDCVGLHYVQGEKAPRVTLVKNAVQAGE